MLKRSKSYAGLIRRAIALVVAYGLVGASLGPHAAAGERLGVTNNTSFLASGAVQSRSVHNRALSSAASSVHGTRLAGNFPLIARSALNNLAGNPAVTAAQGGGSTTVNFFGPEQYVRTTGPPNSYTTTIQVPAWVGNPYNLQILNGTADGSNRVSSATITVNNVQVAGPSDFNQNVYTINRAVTLTPTTTLVVELASKPGSYLTINLGGANQDNTPPVLTIVAPANNSAINTPQAHIDITYQDLPGPGEPAASGVDTSTLQVLLDGTDRTSLFTKFSNEATADLPASLALTQGSHTLAVSIKDFAGNTAQATSQFEVDTTPPIIQIVQPGAGSYVNNSSPLIQIAYSDNFAVNVGSLKVIINGADQTAQFARAATGASATLGLPQGANTIVASISDQAGNQSTASTIFNIDTTPPTISILHPLGGSVHGSSTVEFSIQFSDDQAIDLTSVQVSVDGAVTPFTTTPTSASGSVTLADGSHTLSASVKDKAGNQSTASITFTVDTTAPDIHVVQPAAGTFLNIPTPLVVVQIGSSQDLDPTTFHVSIDGTDETAFFPLNGLTASGTSPALPDGTHTISAQVAKVTGIVGQTQISVVIDTVPPQISIDPIGFTNNPTPAAVVRYSDSGSGVNLSTLHILLDGADVTASFSQGASSAQGILGAGAALAEGRHSLQATIADNAGNISSTASMNFTVDLTPPTATFTSPANNSFINTTQPTITLTYSDSISGINLGSIHIFLQPVNQPQTEITSLFTVSATEATAVISPSAPLAAGTYELSAQVSDLAGNQATPTSLFAIDLTPPTYNIVSPAANAYLNTATPNFVITYQDDSSGVDPSKFVLLIDGVDRTADLKVTTTGASGALTSVDALADGTHTVAVNVFDRAGNEASVVPQSFLIDTIPPTLNIVSPLPGGYANISLTPITVSYSDGGSGVDVTTFKLSIDGVDQSAQFTVTPTGATGSAATALANGPHTVTASIKNLAGNLATATVTYILDTVPPQITITQPTNGLFTNATSLVVTGSVVDAAPVTVTVAGAAVPVQNGSFSSAGITLGTNAVQTIPVVATDAAGNSSTVTLTINIDRTPPTITDAINPPPNAAGWNNTPVTVTFTCSDAGSGVANCSAPVSVSVEGANQVITGTATDNAGNTAQITVAVNIDETPPTIVAVAAPPPNSAGWNTSNVTITYTCSDALSGVLACPPPQLVTTEGKAQQITATVSDKAGNTAAAAVSLNIEKTNPTITATASPAPNTAGWNNTNVTVTFTCTASVSPITSCTPPQTVSSLGAGQVISGTVQDQAGNQATASVTLNISEAPPSILQFSTPSQLSIGQTGAVSLTVSDTTTITAVVFQLNGANIASFTSSPYTTTISVPSSANAGDTLTVTAIVTDIAGNTTTANRGVQVVAAGAIVGQVLKDATGLPLQGATVQIIGGTGQDISDSNGRYSIPANNTHLFLGISMAANSAAGTPAMVNMEREVFLQNGVGNVPVDARMTPVAPFTAVSTTGGTLLSGPITVTIPAGVVASSTNFYLTSLSQQGLPELLPLGWSPIAAFDLRSDSPAPASFNAKANFTQLPATTALNLVQYDYGSHAWLMVTPNLTVSNGALATPVPGLGDFALATADTGNTSIVIPAAGQPLTGVPMVPLPSGASASGSLSPASVAPTGGTSQATLAINSPTPVPSGTVIQASVLESYTQAGKALSNPARTEDILLYQYGAPSGSVAVASFPVTASQTFPPEQAVTGDIHLDILSGRESVRGEAGGSDAVTVTGGNATLTVSAGSLPQDTAVNITPESVNGFLPSTTTLVPVAEFNIDFSGLTLNIPAQLSVAASGAQAGSNLFLAQIQRVNDAPYLVVVSLAQVNGGNLVTQAVPGLPGITQGGDYVFYQVNSPTGFVSGTVSASSGPVAAIIQTDGLPFVSFSSFSGVYLVPALAGTVNLTANVPNTALAGTGSVQVTAGQTATANLTVIGQSESATVSPANGAVGVPLTAEIDITAPDPLNQATVTSTSVILTQNGASTPIPIRFVFSQDGTRLSVFPQSALQPSTTYTLAASGIANTLGALVTVPTVSFTTLAVTPTTLNTSALVFGMPDQNGNVPVTAAANSFPAGSIIFIVDQTNGVVLSLTVANDGSVSGQLPATIDDVLAVTITAPDKTTVSFTLSQFVAADGTTAIGPGGGTVTGPGNIAMIIPQGALTKGTTFKLAPLDQTAFPQLPGWTSGTLNFGNGIQITAPAMPSFNNEVKLAFPVPPNAPPGAFFYVFRRLVDQHNPNNIIFETIDHAFVQGTGANAQVVTASPPFCGYMNSFGNFQSVAAASYQPLQAAVTFTFMMWDFDPNQAGVASPGLIVGRVFQNDASGNPGPLVNGAVATITLTNNPQYTTTTDPACGTYSLFDPELGGGTRSVTATATVPTFNAATNQTTTQKQSIVATADEVNGIQPDDNIFSVTAGLEAEYRNIGRLNFTFAPPVPPPPPPQINIGVYTLDANNNRQPISGIVQTGTALTITFSSTLSVVGATINGSSFSSVVPDAPPANPVPGLTYTRLNDTYSTNTPGLYTIVATALDPLNPGATPATVSRTFLVVAAGGGASPTNGVAPAVVGWDPDKNAQGVATSVFPEITFSEPVTNVPGNVTLTGSPAGDSPTLLLIGVREDGSLANPVQSADAIVSLTVQPLTGLEFGETYTLTLGTGILGTGTDQNNNPIPLAQPFVLSFTTFGPQALGGSSSQYSVITRPVIIGQRAYAGELVSDVITGLGIFDITDPANPVDKGVGPSFVGRGTDIAGLAQSPVTSGPLVAISAGTAQDVAIPANVWLYDVSSPDQPNRVGAVSVSSSATQSGVALRIVMKDNYLYASTLFQGLQVVDLQQVVGEFQQASPTAFGQAVSTEGQGFAMDAIINDIQLPTPSGGTATMFDLQADDFATTSLGSAAATQTLLAATGQLPLVMADPTLSGPSAILYPATSNGSLSQSPLQMVSPDGTTAYQMVLGRAVALGTIAVTNSTGATVNQHIAVLVGSGRTGPVATVNSAPMVPALMVVDVSQVYTPGAPFTPIPVGFLQLSTTATDVTLNGSVALVGTGSHVLLVNLENPSQPTAAGQVTGSFGNWLAVTPGGILIGTSSVTGIQTAALNVVPVILNVTPQSSVDQNFLLTTPIDVTYQLQGSTTTVASGNLLIQQDGANIGSIPLPSLQPGVHTVTIPVGTRIVPPPLTVKFTILRPDGTPSTFETPLGPIPSDTLDIPTASGAAQASVDTSTPSLVPTLTIAPPVISVQPDQVNVGQGDTVISISGETLTSVSIMENNGSTLTASVATDSQGNQTFVLPAAASAQPGFLIISDGSAGATTAAIAVVDQTLPALGTAPNISISDVLSSATASGIPTIDIEGSPLVSGMQVVFVRDNVPVVSVPAQFDSILGLSISQPTWFETVDNDRLSVAVLTSDLQELSNAVSTPAFTTSAPEPTFPIDNPQPDNSALSFAPGDVEITGGFRNIINPNTSVLAQASALSTITLRGVGLQQGMPVTLEADRGDQILTDTASLGSLNTISSESQVSFDPSDGPFNPHPDLDEGSVALTPKIKLSLPTIQIVALRSDGQVAGVSTGSNLNVAPLAIPFGGRVIVAAYQDKSNPFKIYALTPDEARQGVNQGALTIMPQATITINTSDGGNPLAQVETEAGDPQGSVRIRGLSMTQFPAGLPQDRINRPSGKVLVNGLFVRSLNVYYVNLGATYAWHDVDIARAANNHQIPPQYLKSQVLQESAKFQGNFRYEQSTIDFNQLTGDRSPQITQRPYCLYALPGQYLSSNQSPSNAMSFAYNQQAAGQTTFTIGQIKRRAGTHFTTWADPKTSFAAVQGNPSALLSYITENDPAVAAQINAVDPKTGAVTSQKLTLVRDGPTWVKYGTKGQGYGHGLVRQVPANNQPSPTQFTVNYDTGLVTIGRQLNPGETLVVSGFQSLPGTGTTKVSPLGGQGATCGSFAFGLQVGPNATVPPPDLNDPTIVKAQFNLHFIQGENLYQFFNDNIAQRPSGDFLSGTVSDRNVEFKASGSTPASTPTTMLDPKYQYATAQPYASASYGALQLTLLAWTNGATGRTLGQLFNIQSAQSPLRSIFELLHFVDAQGHTMDSNLEDYGVKNSLELGAAYSQSFQSVGGLSKGSCVATCNQNSWQQNWSSVFVRYNDDSSLARQTPPAVPFYAPVPGGDGRDTLVKRGDQCFTPTAYYLIKPPQGSACYESTNSPLY